MGFSKSKNDINYIKYQFSHSDNHVHLNHFKESCTGLQGVYFLLFLNHYTMHSPYLECEFHIMLHAQNCCQHFLHEKMLLKEGIWGLSFEDHRMYGMDIPRRLHVRLDMKQ
jgi:hypothetical protein